MELHAHAIKVILRGEMRDRLRQKSPSKTHSAGPILTKFTKTGPQGTDYSKGRQLWQQNGSITPEVATSDHLP